MTNHIAVVEFPVRRIFVWNEQKILAVSEVLEFDKEFGRHAFNRMANARGYQSYGALMFTDGTQSAPLVPSNQDNTLKISAGGLFAILWNLAQNRPGTHAVIDNRDLRKYFVRGSSALANAERWCENVLPFLMAGVPQDNLPVGSLRSHTIKEERAGRGDLWQAVHEMFDGFE